MPMPMLKRAFIDAKGGMRKGGVLHTQGDLEFFLTLSLRIPPRVPSSDSSESSTTSSTSLFFPAGP